MKGYDIVSEDFPGLTDEEILTIASEGECPSLYGLDEVAQHACDTGVCLTCWVIALEKEYGNN